MKTLIEKTGKKIEIITEHYTTKIENNGGAAPWMVGRTVKTSTTWVYVNGERQFIFPFNHKRHNNGGIGAKNQLDQLLSYIE